MSAGSMTLMLGIQSKRSGVLNSPQPGSIEAFRPACSFHSDQADAEAADVVICGIVRDDEQEVGLCNRDWQQRRPGDDAIKLYFDTIVTNTSITMIQNCVPFQFGWGTYQSSTSQISNVYDLRHLRAAHILRVSRSDTAHPWKL